MHSDFFMFFLYFFLSFLIYFVNTVPLKINEYRHICKSDRTTFKQFPGKREETDTEITHHDIMPDFWYIKYKLSIQAVCSCATVSTESPIMSSSVF